MTATAHIRDRQPRVRGNGFYRVQGHDAPNLCGAPYSQEDLRFGDMPSALKWLRETKGRGVVIAEAVWQNGTSDNLRDVSFCPECLARYEALRAA